MTSNPALKHHVNKQWLFDLIQILITMVGFWSRENKRDEAQGSKFWKYEQTLHSSVWVRKSMNFLFYLKHLEMCCKANICSELLKHLQQKYVKIGMLVKHMRLDLADVHSRSSKGSKWWYYTTHTHPLKHSKCGALPEHGSHAGKGWDKVLRSARVKNIKTIAEK